MKKKLFTKIHAQKKKKINISLDASLKAKLEAQREIDNVSISEQIESLYRTHKASVEAISMSSSEFERSRGERGKAMFGDAVRQPCGIFLTPEAIAFFKEQAKQKNSDRSKIIGRSLEQIIFKAE